ncbi:MAG: hypothetical protein VKK42_25015 [Lyngbya sp.]|nr:hypothetical protein [Lyngbya sp.]
MFVENDSSGGFGQPPTGDFSQPTPHFEPVRMTLSGSRQAVMKMIRLLHGSHIILAGEWSNAIAIKNSAEVISVAVRTIQLD